MRSCLSKFLMFSAVLFFLVSGQALAQEQEKVQEPREQAPDHSSRRLYYQAKGVSESFYDKYIGPFSFHLKWQAGPSSTLHRKSERALIRQIDKNEHGKSINVSLDLVSFYLHPERQSWMFGFVVHATSQSVESQVHDLQIDHYMAALSFVYFYSEFKRGYYWRLDGGILWREIDVVGPQYNFDDGRPGSGWKLGFGHAFEIKAQPALSLEAFYFGSYATDGNIDHSLALALGFIL